MSKTEGIGITIQNKDFISLAAACRHYGIKVGTARYRLKTGWSIKQIFNIENKPNNFKSKKIRVNGIQYNSIREACKHYKLDYRTVSSRMHKGWSIEAVFNINNKYSFIVNNKEFTYLKRACKHYNLDPCTVKQRINRGWSIDEAFELVKRKAVNKCKGKVYKITNTVNNKVYIGITTNSVSGRFCQHKKEARSGSMTKFHKAIRDIGDHKFKIQTIKRSCNKHDLIKYEVKFIKKYNSIKHGYNTAVGGSNLGEKHGKEITYKGIKFISHTALAEYLGLSRTELWRRIKLNTI